MAQGLQILGPEVIRFQLEHLGARCFGLLDPTLLIAVQSRQEMVQSRTRLGLIGLGPDNGLRLVAQQGQIACPPELENARQAELLRPRQASG